MLHDGLHCMHTLPSQPWPIPKTSLVWLLGSHIIMAVMPS